MKNKTSLTTSETDFAALAALKSENIDLSDIPEVTPEMFAQGILRRGGIQKPVGKTLVSLRIDNDVLEWFRTRGKGYQTEVNALLKAYKEAHSP